VKFRNSEGQRTVFHRGGSFLDLQESMADLTPLHSASEVARFLAISRVNAGRYADRGKKVLDKYQDLRNVVQ